jgi:beta-ureidopropionase
MAQIIYERPIYPKNRYVDRIPGKHDEYRKEVIERQVALLQERGIWKPPSR